jgi:hypothetical protein
VCEMTTTKLADELLLGSGCYSVIGPVESVYFSDAALLREAIGCSLIGTQGARVVRPPTVT